jgi:hypothetical protein
MILKTFTIPTENTTQLLPFIKQFGAHIVSLKHISYRKTIVAVRFPKSEIDNWNDVWHHDPSKQI